MITWRRIDVVDTSPAEPKPAPDRLRKCSHDQVFWYGLPGCWVCGPDCTECAKADSRTLSAPQWSGASTWNPTQTAEED